MLRYIQHHHHQSSSGRLENDRNFHTLDASTTVPVVLSDGLLIAFSSLGTSRLRTNDGNETT